MKPPLFVCLLPARALRAADKAGLEMIAKGLEMATASAKTAMQVKSGG